MDLTTFSEPARTRKVGDQEVILTSPATLRISTTGAGAVTLLSSGPDSGKVWTVTIRVEIKETNA
jgi:hypothetical protein